MRFMCILILGSSTSEMRLLIPCMFKSRRSISLLLRSCCVFFFLFDFFAWHKNGFAHIRQTLTLPIHLFSRFCLHFGRCCCCYSRHSSDISIHRICKMNEFLCVFIQNSLVYIIHWTNNDANDDEQKEYAMYACVSWLHKHKTKWL